MGAYLPLTRAGWTALAVAALLYGGAVALGYPELAVLATACVLAVLTGLAWTLPTRALRVHREIEPSRVARGDPAVAVVTIANPGRRRRGRLTVVDVCGDGVVDVEAPNLPARGRRTISYRLPTGRRGEIAVGPLRLLRADPLGMARRVQPCGGQETLLVRPRVYALAMLAAGRARHLEGSVSDTAPSGTVTFRALREYVPGDDLRHVHWRSSARLGTLMTRELVDASRPRTTIVLDVRPGAYADADRFELAVDSAASVAVAAGRRSFPVRIVTTSGPLLETKGGRADAGALLDRLALVTLQAGGTLASAFEAVRNPRAGGLLVVVSGDVEGTELGRLTMLRGRFDRVVVVRAASPRQRGEGAPPGVGWIEASSAESLVAGWQREAAR